MRQNRMWILYNLLTYGVVNFRNATSRHSNGKETWRLNNSRGCEATYVIYDLYVLPRAPAILYILPLQ